MALAVGQNLTNAGQLVEYTRVTDIYQTPYEKAQMANYADADYFLSIHRNAMPVPGTASGSETLVYKNTGVPAMLARNINQELEAAGFNNLGVIERPNLVVLRDTKMPAALVEAGFIDNERDNTFFDHDFDQIANAISQGVLRTIQEEEEPPLYYQIQVGAFQNKEVADQLAQQLQSQDLPAFVIYQDGLYKVRVGAYLSIDNAARMEQMLRNMGYSTVMVREAAVE